MAESPLWKQFELQASLLAEQCRTGPLPLPQAHSAKRQQERESFHTALAARIDHTLLKPEATHQEITALCEQAMEHGFATVCVQSGWLPEVVRIFKRAKNKSVKPITVVGFPHGATLTESKVAETRTAIRAGAREIDMVIAVGRLKSRHFDIVLNDIRAVVKAAGSIPVKVILETALLTDPEKVMGSVLAQLAGAAFVKTCTGFSSPAGGATVEDIRLLRATCAPHVKIKASGGIRNAEAARQLIEAGADRLGASSSVTLITQQAPAPGTAAPGDY